MYAYKGKDLYCSMERQRDFPLPVPSQHWPLPFESNETCNTVISELGSDCINSRFMHYILYVCRNIPEKEVFDKILKALPNFNSIIQLEHSKLNQYYFHIKNITSTQKQCEIIYGKAKKFENKLVRVLASQELKCLKLLFDKDSNYTELFYLNEKYFSEQQDALLRAVDLNDVYSLTLILNSSNISQDKLGTSLRYAYYRDLFEIAEILLKKGAILLPEYIIRPFPIASYATYKKHSDIISKLPEVKFYFVDNLVEIIFYKKDVSKVDIVGNAVNILKPQNLFPTNNNLSFKIYNYSESYIASEILIAASSINTTAIIVDKLAEPHSAFFNFGNLNYPYKDHYIYVSSEKFSTYAIHELTHLVLGYVYHNEGKPYFSKSSPIEYIKAQTYFLSNVLNLIGNVETPHNFDRLEPILANHYMLYANSWYLNQESDNKFKAFLKHTFNTDTKNKLKDFGSYKEIAKLVSNIEKNKIQIVDLIEIENFVLQEGLDLGSYLAKALSVDIKDARQLISDYEVLKTLTKNGVNSFYNTHTSIRLCASFLERVFDYVKREPESWDIELLPRIPEIYTLPQLNSHVITVSQPLITYFKDHVIPRIHEVFSHMETCEITQLLGESEFLFN
jgi:hypothetical protein